MNQIGIVTGLFGGQVAGLLLTGSVRSRLVNEGSWTDWLERRCSG